VDPRGGGREHVPAVERVARRLVVVVGDLVDADRFITSQPPGCRNRDAVVGGDDPVVASFDDDGCTVGADTGVNDDEVGRSGEVGSTSRSQNAAARPSCRGKSWAISTSRASERWRMTPFIAAG